MLKKIEIKRYLYIGIIAVMIQMLFCLTGYLNKNYNVYIDLTYIYCGTIAIGLSIISILRKNDSFYKYLGISFLGVGILEYFRIFIKIQDISEKANDFANIAISLCVGNFEIIVVFIGMILTFKKVSNTKAVVVNIVVFLGNCMYTYAFIKLEISLVVYLIISATCLYIFYKMLKKNNIYDFQIIGYMTILFFSAIIRTVFMVDGYIYIFIANTLRMVAYFLIYEGISEKIYSIELNELEKNLREGRKETKKISSKIKTRKTIIDELSKMKKREEAYHYEIIDSFSEGILIEGETIKYVNKVAIELFGIENSNEFLVKDLANGVLEKAKSGERIKVKLNGKTINLEIYIAKIQAGIRIFYIKKIDDILKYEELLRQYESYVRKENVKNEFYTNISHELRTPINIVSSALEVNEIKLRNSDLDKIESNNILIKKNCLRLIRTINNFIDANKISEGYLVLNRKRYNIVEVVEDIVQASVKYIENYDMNIVFDSSDEEIIVSLDRDFIERAILNLLSNSVKYREKKGEKIDVEIVKYGDYVYIVVSNNGTRIDKIEEGNIFEKFKKLDNGLNRENEGSGLGLFLCREIIEAHNGEIRLHSNNYIRNEFVIKLEIEKGENKIDINRNINSLEEKVQIEFSDIN
ncbi:MAG: sensor histidine kinase [Clostridium sp.]